MTSPRQITYTNCTLAASGLFLCCDATAESSPVEVSASAVIIYQTANSSNVDSELSASGEIMLQKNTTSGGWLAHFEAASSLDPNKVSTVLPQANGDAGSALDEQDQGRIQLSQLYYKYSFLDNHDIQAGLIDVSNFFDQSRTASDENTQFLGTSFTLNPTIAFPDYTIGAVYQGSLKNGFEIATAIASSNGLADNPERSYTQLLTVNQDNKGLFSIASVSWQHQGWLIRSGAWLNSADYVTMDSTNNDDGNYGFYALTGYRQGQHAFDLRYGAANPSVSLAKTFASASYLYDAEDYALGTGISRTFVTDELAADELENTTHLNFFARYKLRPELLVTADVQRILNSQSAASDRQASLNATVLGLRLTWLYE